MSQIPVSTPAEQLIPAGLRKRGLEPGRLLAAIAFYGLWLLGLHHFQMIFRSLRQGLGGGGMCVPTCTHSYVPHS